MIKRPTMKPYTMCANQSFTKHLHISLRLNAVHIFLTNPVDRWPPNSVLILGDEYPVSVVWDNNFWQTPLAVLVSVSPVLIFGHLHVPHMFHLFLAQYIYSIGLVLEYKEECSFIPHSCSCTIFQQKPLLSSLSVFFCNETRPYLCFSPIFTMFISTHIAFLCCHMIRDYSIVSFIVTWSGITAWHIPGAWHWHTDSACAWPWYLCLAPNPDTWQASIPTL
jgi:hypothetical protein